MALQPERLWNQYVGKARAELLRGSGWWPMQDTPCRLEPPLEPFEPRQLTVWDCVVNGWETPYQGGWLRSLLNGGQTVHQLSEPLVLPSVPLPDSSDHIVIRVEQFPEDETTLPVADQLLRSLLALRRPVTFELNGLGAEPKWDHERICSLVETGYTFERAMDEAFLGWTEPKTAIQFVAHKADAGLLQQQLILHYPNSAVIRDSADRTDLGVRLAHDDNAWGCTLALEGLHVFPLRSFRQLAPDVLAVAIAAMEDLDKDDWAILQIQFQPARGDWSENAFAALTNPCNPSDTFLESDDLREAKAKFSSPLFAVSVRLAASRFDVFQQLVSWAEQFSNAPRQKLVVNKADWTDGRPPQFERAWIDLCVNYRCTRRPGMLLSTEELAGLVHLPGSHIVSERLRRTRLRTRPAKAAPSTPGSVFLGQNVHRGETREARIPAQIRPWHCYIAGATGTGKSTLLLNMLLQDIHAGAGVGVLDPHGDLVADILPQIPENRIGDVVYFNPADVDYPPALNILQATGRLEREHLVNEAVATFQRFFPDAWGPRLQHILLHSLATVSLIRGGTIRDIRRILTDPNYRYRVVSKLTDPDLIAFWNQEFPELPKGSTDPVLNKLSPFLMKAVVRNIVCQPRTAINFDQVLNGRKILLANLSFGLLGEAVAGTLGTFLMTKLLGATFRRAALPKDRRPLFYLYVDEFQNFLNLGRGFDKILSEARKFGLVLAGMANQYVRQISEVRAAIFGNVGTIITFRLGLDDARLLARDLQGFTAEEIMSLQLGEAFARVGSSQNVFNLTTSPPPRAPDVDHTRRIIKHCRQKYATPRPQVEQRFRRCQAPTSATKSRRTRPAKSDQNTSPPREVTPDDLSDFVA